MKRSLRVGLIAAAIASFSPVTLAAGLGTINILSGLGQPLRAEIPLQATPQELESLSARIPSPEVFKQADVAYSPLVNIIRIDVEQRGMQPVLLLSSERPINEPFLELLVELSWASGQVRREYTFLLDPPERAATPVAVPAATARPTQAAAPAQASRPAAPAMTEPRVDRYTVTRGDTLSGIASRLRPSGSTLDQMLVALLRGNPEAFEAGNMNRLHAGAILNIPDAQTARAVEPAEARRIIVSQAEDFEQYRHRLAGTVAAQPARAAASERAQSGEITEPVAAGDEMAEESDRVQVSGAADASEPDPANRIKALEEELVARDQALQDTNNRLSELEQSIRDLQHLIELRNESLALLQQQLETQGGEGAMAAMMPVGTAEAAVLGDDPAMPTGSSSGWMDSMLQDRALIAGGGALTLLLAYAAYRMGRRRSEEETEAAVRAAAATAAPVEGGRSRLHESLFDESAFSQSGLSAIDSDEGVDPVAEADVYMAYGRDAQAEEILIDALQVAPDRHAIYLELLELYARRGNARQFEVVATDLYARTGGAGKSWERAAAMGRQLDPVNQLYQGVEGEDAAPSPAAGAALAAAASATAWPDADHAHDDDHAADFAESGVAEPTQILVGHETYVPAGTEDAQAEEPAAGFAAPAFEADEMAVEFQEPEDVSRLPADATTGLDLDFDLDLPLDAGQPSLDDFTADETNATAASPTPEEAGTSGSHEAGALDEELLDFDLDLSAPAYEAPASAAAPAFDFSDLNLDLDPSLTDDAEDAASAAPASVDEAQAFAESDNADDEPGPDAAAEVDTKLELARAYEDMGDAESARELVAEILNEGSDAQRDAAQALAERLG